METDFSIKLAMETAVSQAESFDQSDFAAGDSVPVFRPNAQTGRDELVGKIPKSYFMQAAIASMKDLLRGTNLGTNIDKVPTLNANNFGSTSIADLASVLGEVFTGDWNGGTFETMAKQGKQCCYYVDKDHNEGKRDFPYDYCIVSISYTQGSGGTDAVIAHAFNVITGEVSMKVVQSFGSARDYPWRDIPIGLPTFYKNYGDLAALSVGLNSPIRTTMGSNHDPDTYLDTSCGYCEIDASKSPTGAYRGWGFLVIRLAGDFVVQFITPDNTSATDIYYRKYYRGSFSEWKKII